PAEGGGTAGVMMVRDAGVGFGSATATAGSLDSEAASAADARAAAAVAAGDSAAPARGLPSSTCAGTTPGRGRWLDAGGGAAAGAAACPPAPCDVARRAASGAPGAR